jgi:TnpA family transposase
MGLKRMADADPGATYDDLRYVRRQYITKEQLRAASAAVANAIFRVRRPTIWGEGTTACASDSKKFGSWDQNLMTEWHIRYGGKGVMIYWHLRHEVVYVAVETGYIRIQPRVLPLDPTRTCGKSNLAV